MNDRWSDHLLKASLILDRIVTWLGIAVAWLTIPPIIVSTVSGILARRLLGGATLQFQALEGYLFFALILLTLAITYLRDGHVRIDVLHEGMSPAARAWVELIGGVIVIVPFCLMLIRYGTTFALQSFRVGETAELGFDLPLLWLVKAAVPFASLLLLLAAIAVIVRNALFLAGRHGKEPATGEHR